MSCIQFVLRFKIETNDSNTNPCCVPQTQEDEYQTMLLQEKAIRMRVSVMVEEKSQRMRQLKALTDQDQDLCDLLCSEPFPISPDRVPSTEQLQKYKQHVAQMCAERVR